MNQPTPQRQPEQIGKITLADFQIGAASGVEPGVELCGIHLGEPQPCNTCQMLREEASRRREIMALAGMKDIQIGKRYTDKGFDDYQPVDDAASQIKGRCMKYAATFPDRLVGCDSLLMLGKPGTGKNMLAACICKTVVSQGHTALHTTAMKLVRRIKTSWGKNSDKDEQELIDQFSKPDLLVVDEVGVQFGSQTEKILLFEVINGRYEEMKPTILISNLSLAEIEVYLGATLIDRFYEGRSAVLEFTWGSYRRR